LEIRSFAAVATALPLPGRTGADDHCLELKQPTCADGAPDVLVLLPQLAESRRLTNDAMCHEPKLPCRGGGEAPAIDRFETV